MLLRDTGTTGIFERVPYDSAAYLKSPISGDLLLVPSGNTNIDIPLEIKSSATLSVRIASFVFDLSKKIQRTR